MNTSEQGAAGGGTGGAPAPMRPQWTQGRGLFVRLNRKMYPEVHRYLAEQGFGEVVLRGGEDNPLGQRGRTVAALASAGALLRQLGRLRRAEVLVSAPKSVTVLVKLAAALGLVKARRHLCWAYFAHSLRMLRIYGWVARLDRARDRYLVYSQAEVEAYSRAMGVPRERFLVLPYSDWDRSDQRGLALEPGDKSRRYFFSGGYSNRDYPALIELFRRLPHERLVIVCSAINRELDGIALPANVEVLRDVPSWQFNRLITEATAAIVPIRDNVGGAGGAGQSVLVSCFKLGTPILITASDVTREYIDHGITGWLLESLDELVPIIDALDPASAEYRRMTLAARRRYVEVCSYEAAASRVAVYLDRDASLAVAPTPRLPVPDAALQGEAAEPSPES